MGLVAWWNLCPWGLWSAGLGGAAGSVLGNGSNSVSMVAGAVLLFAIVTLVFLLPFALGAPCVMSD